MERREADEDENNGCGFVFEPMLVVAITRRRRRRRRLVAYCRPYFSLLYCTRSIFVCLVQTYDSLSTA